MIDECTAAGVPLSRVRVDPSTLGATLAAPEGVVVKPDPDCRGESSSMVRVKAVAELTTCVGSPRPYQVQVVPDWLLGGVMIGNAGSRRDTPIKQLTKALAETEGFEPSIRLPV